MADPDRDYPVSAGRLGGRIRAQETARAIHVGEGNVITVAEPTVLVWSDYI